MTKKSIYKRLLITSDLQFICVMLVFAITGSMSLYVSQSVTEIMNIDLSNLSPLIFWPIRILSVFIFYQILLIIVAIPFGQFSYFLRVEKKMLSRFGLNLN